MKRRELNLADMYLQPGYLIRRAHQTATAAFAVATADLDLTAVQFSALIAIKDNPDVDATRVSEMIAFDRTTIGHVLGRLEEKKLITRRDGVVDKRTKLIRLTLKGESMIREVSQRIDGIATTILKPFSANEQATLLRLLTRFATPGEPTTEETAARKRRQADDA
jgi:MarR family transcriptional regulator, lower aerobic nicotinate degradation pathway regulator